ncbi:hypothetical protein PFISCL1PPCAC_2756, partial [Pristionchus fissidentatus]
RFHETHQEIVHAFVNPVMLPFPLYHGSCKRTSNDGTFRRNISFRSGYNVLLSDASSCARSQHTNSRTYASTSPIFLTQIPSFRRKATISSEERRIRGQIFASVAG